MFQIGADSSAIAISTATTLPRERFDPLASRSNFALDSLGTLTWKKADSDMVLLLFTQVVACITQ